MAGKPCLPENRKVLVVGTTSDYIDWIQTASPGRVLFMTDPEVRKNAREPAPGPGDELILPLTDIANSLSETSENRVEYVLSKLERHLLQWNQSLSCIMCFDCEFLELTARIATARGLRYHSVQAVLNCRDKYVSKNIWQESGVPCPQAVPVNNVEDAVRFLSNHGNGIVLKPFYGSGSELVYRCRTPEECKGAFETISDGLQKRDSKPLFLKRSSCLHLMMAEQFIVGNEYSCDFIIHEDRIQVVRVTRKIKSPGTPFGTASGYVLPATLPSHVELDSLTDSIHKGAKSLGLNHGLCMVDFIIDGRHPYLIEMTPRPGGDCLPHLLKAAGDLDILNLALDVAEEKPIELNGSVVFAPHIGLRIHASKTGIFKGYNLDQLANDKRLKQIHFIRQPGHRVVMPPEDYDSWLLGHMIIQPDSTNYPETQCLLIKKRLQVVIE